MQRPGGRTEKNRAAVFAAAAALMAERPGAPLVIAEVAARAGVHPTTIYRRWQTAEALALDVAMTELEARSPLPDTGSLRGDLLAFAARVVAILGKPSGQSFLRTLMSAPGEYALLAHRAAQLQAMIDRSSSRLTTIDVLDGILAPIYTRALLGMPLPAKPRLELLVDRTIALAKSRR